MTVRVGGGQCYRGGEKAVLVMWLTWGRIERVGSKVTPRLRIWVEEVTMEPSILSAKS